MLRKLIDQYDKLIIAQSNLLDLLEKKYENEASEVFNLLEDILGKVEPIIEKERELAKHKR